MESSEKVVYLVRHAESKWNCATAEERKSGEGLRDADLSPRGEGQLKKLVANLPPGIKAIYCSPLIRTIRTAQAISIAADGIPIVAVASLREIRRDIGDVGTDPAALRKLFPGVRGIEALPDKWWASAGDSSTCQCSDTNECSTCAAAHLEEAQRALQVICAGVPAAVVTHYDLIESMTGWKAENAEMARFARDTLRVRP
jgi:broad specificity phosphatase PhoE